MGGEGGSDGLVCTDSKSQKGSLAPASVPFHSIVRRKEVSIHDRQSQCTAYFGHDAFECTEICVLVWGVFACDVLSLCDCRTWNA